MKRTTNPSTPAEKKKKAKQQSLATSFANAKASPSLPQTTLMNADVETLNNSHLQEIESAFENYCQSWGEKCQTSSNKLRGGVSRKDINLDKRGMELVKSFQSLAQTASIQGATVPHIYLEALCLVMRNDVVHESSFVSRAAHTALLSYLDSHPYTTLSHYSGESRLPCVVSTPAYIWTPLEYDRTSFTSKYLLTPDMSIAGRNYHIDRKQLPTATAKRLRDQKWTSPADAIMHCLDMALKCSEIDFNGDLQMLHYLTRVMEQDVGVREVAVRELDGVQLASPEKTAEFVAARKMRVLDNSLVWMIFAGQLVSKDKRGEIVRALIALIIRVDAEDCGDMEDAESEEYDDAPAGACIYTLPELSALAARILRLLLRVFGAVEAAGGFFDRSPNRICKGNLRMDLDRHMMDAFWSGKGICWEPHRARALLRSLPPADRLRFVGILVAQKFCGTYTETGGGLNKYGVAEIAPPLRKIYDTWACGGTELQTFFQVDVGPAIASLHLELARALTIYKSADNLAVVLGAVVAAVTALVAGGEGVPGGEGGMHGLMAELNRALKAIADASVHGTLTPATATATGETSAAAEGQKEIKLKESGRLTEEGVAEMTIAYATVQSVLMPVCG